MRSQGKMDRPDKELTYTQKTNEKTKMEKKKKKKEKNGRRRRII